MPNRFEKLVELNGERTKGPWVHINRVHRDTVRLAYDYFVEAGYERKDVNNFRPSDAEFIALSANLMDEMLEVVRAANDFFAEPYDSGIDLSRKWADRLNKIRTALSKLQD